jgi:tetratricopeptide (TPR) repeat protein
MEFMSKELRSERQKARLDEIESDIENVRAGWRYLASEGNTAEIAKIVDSLWYFHEIRGWYHAAVELFRQAEANILELGSDEEKIVVTSQMMGASSWFISLLGNVEESNDMATKSVASLRQSQRRKELLIPYMGMAMSNVFLQQIEKVKEAAQESLNIAREINNEWWEAASLSWIGAANVAALTFDDAEYYAKAADKIMNEIGDPWLSFFPSQTLAQAATLQGDHVAAKERFQLALEAAQSINFKRGMAYTCGNLGGVCYSLGEYEEAERYHLQSLRIDQKIGQTREMLAEIYGVARAWAALGKESETIELLAVVLQHPASDQRFLTTPSTIKQDAEQLRAKLESELPPEEYESAWQRGETLELETVVADLLE